MDIKRRNIFIIIGCYIIIIIISTLFYPLLGNINYINQFKDKFLYFLLIGPIHSFILWIIDYNLKNVLFYIIILSGNIIPLFLIFKKNKIFPLIIISIIFFCIYIFLGLGFFGSYIGEIIVE